METSTTYAALLEKATVTLLPNDAVFLGHLLKAYMADNNMESAYLTDLYNHLNGNPYC